MNIKIFNDEIPYIIIDNYYDEQGNYVGPKVIG